MEIKLPQYNGKDNLVMVLIVPMFSFLLNAINFGKQYFSGLNYFLLTTLFCLIAFSIYFIVCGGIAVMFKKRFPYEAQLLKRLSIMIVLFLLITGLFLLSLFHLFENIPYFNYSFNQQAFAWSYLALGIVNIFLTFLMEGIAQYNAWKTNRQETDELNQVYKQSQLQGLKSQVNPHFLFNSLNSLSSLIQENEEQAEKFLDEMSKVYRYMLRNDEEQLVTLETELKFVDSYLHLLKARYGEGLHLLVNVTEEDQLKMLAPLALQVIIENAFTQNVISKANPLTISIISEANGVLQIKNNIQPKAISDALDFESGLDNLVKKYELLSLPLSVLDVTNGYRVIQLPLLTKKEEVVA